MKIHGMALPPARDIRRGAPLRDDAADHRGSVLTTVSSVLLALSILPGLADDRLFAVGHSRPLIVSTTLMLLGRGLYLLFRKHS